MAQVDLLQNRANSHYSGLLIFLDNLELVPLSAAPMDDLELFGRIDYLFSCHYTRESCAGEQRNGSAMAERPNVRSFRKQASVTLSS